MRSVARSRLSRCRETYGGIRDDRDAGTNETLRGQGSRRRSASGFLLKSAPPEELLYAIRSVHNGDSVVAPSTTRRLIGRFLPHLPVTGEPLPGLTELTARERQVLAEVGSGLSNAEIAALLHISEATVKTHVGHIMTKLCLRDRIQAVVYAYETGLVTPQGRVTGPTPR
jgi:DNA-binding NarL/FixJ family response regulator